MSETREGASGPGSRTPRVPHRLTGLEQQVVQAFTDAASAAEGWQRQFAKDHALNDTDFRALTAIYVAENAGRPLTGAALGKELSLSPAAVSYLVDRLVASGHATRDRDPDDRRRLLLRYSQRGHSVAADFFGPLGARTHEALARFDDAELRAAVEVLNALAGSMRLHDSTEPHRHAGAVPPEQPPATCAHPDDSSAPDVE